MRKTLRIILVWTLISLLLQLGAYSLLDKQVAKVLGPVTESKRPITEELEATIPGSNLENIQISYAKDYLAYSENGTLKVFNLKKEKIVFVKNPPGNDQSKGVISYQWLPDRDTLVYFYAKKNPNPVTYITVPVESSQSQSISSTDPETEDPNQKPDNQDQKVEQKAVPKTKTVARYGNPQITELYTLELPNSDENIPPDDRFNQTIHEFPADSQVKSLVVSTTTNLIYLAIKNGSTDVLMEIDVMKNVRTLNRTGETINGMAASDRYGTLFINSKLNGNKQVISLGVGNRQVISKNTNDKVLGVRDGKVYIGEVKNNQLIKIKTTQDHSEMKNNPSLQTEWEGSIPFEDVRTLIGFNGQVVIYSQTTAYLITNGQLEELELLGDENYISDDGSELIRLNRSGTSTHVELLPLQAKGN
ncbi:MAG TPA: hypothetical protein DEF42_03415 [Desulfosporosinus sp.]|nr:hypothetical protein [Desulfosporosinus sp.]